MSSAAGHALVAVAVHRNGREASGERRSRYEVLWLGWLVVLGWGPDLDYLVPALRSTNWNQLRITHSMLGALVLPALTIILFASVRRLRNKRRYVEATLAGLSHLVLDFLVGVHPLPLLWPLSDTEVRLAYGVLPSAGRVDITNVYFWRNLAVEFAIVVPLIVLVRQDQALRRRSSWVLVIVLLLALTFSVSLAR